MRCSRCDKDAVIFIRYSGDHLCKSHFMEFLEQRVKREFRSQVNLKKNSKIGVALSGGKDSSVTLFLLSKIFKNRNDIMLVPILIDEGIGGYRELAIESARKLTARLNLDLNIYKFSDYFSHTIDQIAVQKKEILPCSYCGVFRRNLLNIAAKKNGVDYLATGLNLDDTAQSIVMNIARGDISRLARMGPHETVKEGLIPRIQPLITIPEREVLIYAILNNIEFYHGECPYSSSAVRNEFRDAIDAWELRTPGTRHAILNSYNAIKNVLSDKYSIPLLNTCERCGEPTTGKLCKACELLDSLKKDQ
jgi:uncharacterized protein (TIGR00269 family)